MFRVLRRHSNIFLLDFYYGQKNQEHQPADTLAVPPLGSVSVQPMRSLVEQRLSQHELHEQSVSEHAAAAHDHLRSTASELGQAAQEAQAAAKREFGEIKRDTREFAEHHHVIRQSSAERHPEEVVQGVLDKPLTDEMIVEEAHAWSPRGAYQKTKDQITEDWRELKAEAKERWQSTADKAKSSAEDVANTTKEQLGSNWESAKDKMQSWKHSAEDTANQAAEATRDRL